jgi:hypothetical protein
VQALDELLKDFPISSREQLARPMVLLPLLGTLVSRLPTYLIGRSLERRRGRRDRTQQFVDVFYLEDFLLGGLPPPPDRAPPDQGQVIRLPSASRRRTARLSRSGASSQTAMQPSSNPVATKGGGPGAGIFLVVGRLPPRLKLEAPGPR